MRLIEKCEPLYLYNIRISVIIGYIGYIGYIDLYI